MSQNFKKLIKSPAEIEIMAEGGQKLAVIIDEIASQIIPGMTSNKVEQLAINLIRRSGGESTFKGFHGYPAVSCISINDEVVHGIPSNRIITDGDLVGLDLGLRWKGFCTDTAKTVQVGSISEKVKQLLDVTEQSLSIGLEQVKPGNRIGDIGHAIQAYVEGFGLGVVRDLTGHGIGRKPHEEPSIPNFGKAHTGLMLEEGMALAIEPMVTLGSPAVKQLSDGWTIVTLDGSPAAHFEHTVVVTVDGYRILTQANY